MITSIERFRELIPTLTAQSLDKYTQSIADACGWLRGEILGGALMRVIEQMPCGEQAPELFKLAELAVAYKAYLIAIPKMDVIETDNGFAVVNDDTFAPASQHRVNALSASMAQSLDMAVGELIEFMDQCNQYRDAWKESPVFLALSGSYIPTLHVYRRYGDFQGGYLDFINAGSAFRALIVKYIEPIVSPEYSGSVLAQVHARQISENNLPIVEKLRLAQAGYYLQDHPLGDTFLAQIRETLEGSPDDFPEFKNSALYKKIVKGREQKFNSTSIHVMI